MTEAKGTFEIAEWKEDAYAEWPNGGKLTEARVRQRFSGDIAGEGSVIWIMCYTEPNTARFVGMQRVAATIGGREGAFVMDTDGRFDGTIARGDWSIIPGSGTGALAGISGEGTFVATHGSNADYRIEYELESATVR
jgi:hypothetical protein